MVTSTDNTTMENTTNAIVEMDQGNRSGGLKILYSTKDIGTVRMMACMLR